MIKKNIPLSMVEVLEYAKKNKDSKTDFIRIIKKFTKLKSKEGKELKKRIKEIDSMKLNEKNIVKIIDLMPESAEDLNKLFVEVGLNEDETNKILKTIKEFR